MLTLPANDGLTVTIQATNRCQLSCPYCMATKNGVDIEKETVLRVIHFLLNNLPTSRPITFVWHGGEPMLLGADFFRWAAGVQKVSAGKRLVKNVFQTNGLLIDQSFVELMKDTKDFVPNISMDGPDPITQKSRGVSSSKYDELFRELQDKELPFGVAVVASADVLANKSAVIDYFERRGIHNVGLVPYHAFHESDRDTSPTAKFSLPRLHILDEHVTLSDPHPPATVLYDLAFDEKEPSQAKKEDVTVLGRSLVRGAVKQTVHSGCVLSSFSDGCHRRSLCVAVNGELYPCPRGQNVGLWNYGNVQTGGLDAWLKSTFGPPPFRPTLPVVCSSCRFQDVCHGGCPANAKSMNGSAEQPDYYCESFQKLFEAAETMVAQEYVDTVNEMVEASK